MLEFSNKQIDYYENSTAKINISSGSVRSGKTFITNFRWLKYCKEGPAGKLLLSGRTKDSAKENVLDGTFGIFDIIGESNYRFRESTGDLILFDREIKVVGADNIESEKRIRGQTYAGWYGDEITIHHPSFVKQAIARCSTKGAQIFWTTNPDHPKHFIKTDFIDNDDMKKEGLLKHWHFVLDDNLALDPDYKRMLQGSFSGVFYSRNILGLWVVADGLVYQDSFDENVHVIPEEQIQKMIDDGQFVDYIGGVDWGFTSPMAGLVIGVTATGQYYVIDEFYQVKKRTKTLRKFFKAWESKLGKQFKVIFCDSAEPDRIIALQEDLFDNDGYTIEKGLRAMGADKQIGAGINTVGTTFMNMRLFISSKCKNTIEELGLYRFPEEDDPKFKTGKPLDEDDHAMDALRYAIHNFEKYLLGVATKAARRSKKENIQRAEAARKRYTF
jgi:PBSX family phage terminase large subunit